MKKLSKELGGHIHDQDVAYVRQVTCTITSGHISRLAACLRGHVDLPYKMAQLEEQHEELQVEIKLLGAKRDAAIFHVK